MSFSSHAKGIATPGALQVEFDIPVLTAENPVGDAYVRIWGIDLNIVNNASKLNFANITIMAGMMPGLPMANLQANAYPKRNGIIFQGSIWQSYGNWQGNEQTLDLVITTQLVARPTDTPKIGKNLVFVCEAGQSFSDAIDKSLKAAGIGSKIAVNKNLTPAEQIIFRADSIPSFARQLNEQSKRVMNDPAYYGAVMSKSLDGYEVGDMSDFQDRSALQIDFTDLVGQPTWLDFMTIQLKCVMRSDLKTQDKIKLPKANSIIGSKAFSNLKDDIAYTGYGFVQKIRHVGSSRQPDANSWVSIVDVIPEGVNATNYNLSGGLGAGVNPVGV